MPSRTRGTGRMPASTSSGSRRGSRAKAVYFGSALFNTGAMQSPAPEPSVAASLSQPFAKAPASRARYWVVVFAITLAIVQYIDRVCISQAAPLISADLRLTDKQMGWVFSAFTLAYALFE